MVFQRWYFWLKQTDSRYAGEPFSKDRVGLCETAFNAKNRVQVDSLAGDIESFAVNILDPARECREYVKGYYAVFFTDPDGIKLELHCGPVSRSVKRKSLASPPDVIHSALTT
jgi:hypothetical protein